MSEQKIFRCAIYTRKSSEEGLDQDFNSLEAQHEACEAYIKSQSHEGWRLISDRFDDGGFSGGNMERPALRQLMTMVDAAKVDIIVVYKIDRLTRSLTDFAKLADRLDVHGVSFVSVTQQFNTTTSMGRLMLNVLLSFAQFEREITGERIRDKIAASKRKGMWMGGSPPMGYDVVNRQLVVNQTDAAAIRRVFNLYLEESNVPALLDRLRREDIRTAARYSAKGNHYGNRPFARGHLYRLLANPIYIGRVPHKTMSHRGQHDAIIEKAIWDAVQLQLLDNTQGSRTRRRRAKAQTDLLEGLLVSERGNSFTLNHANKGARRYQYYVEQLRVAAALETPTGTPVRLPAKEIEDAAIAGVRAFLSDHRGLLYRLGDVPPSQTVGVLAAAARIVDALSERLSVDEIGRFRNVVASIEYQRDRLLVRFSEAGLRSALGLADPSRDSDTLANVPNAASAENYSIAVPLSVRRRGQQMKLVIAGAARPADVNSALVTAVVRAWDWTDQLVNGSTERAGIARDQGFSAVTLKRLLRLAFLSPRLVEDILAGRQPPDLTVEQLIADPDCRRPAFDSSPDWP